MVGEPLDYRGAIRLYPEYCGYTYEELEWISHSYPDALVVASIVHDRQNLCLAFRRGVELYRRGKCRLYGDEKFTVERGVAPYPFVDKVLGYILPIVCYELMFPEDYIGNYIGLRLDYVVHMVGWPMVSEEQREGWVAMHKALSIVLGCPVLCCCGGKRGRMNITGVVTKQQEV